MKVNCEPMDQQLKDLMGYTEEDGKKKRKGDLEYLDYSGRIEIGRASCRERV